MKRALSLLLITCLLVLGINGIADAVVPSGPGQTTAAHSVSVVFASDATMPAVTITGGATSAKQDTGNTSLATIATNTTSIATSALQTSANTKLDTLHTDIGTTIDADLKLLKQPTTTTAITISDSTDVTTTCTKGFWVGTGGDVAVKGTGDSAASTIKNVQAGDYVPGAYQRIMSTNTTASNIVCFSGP